MSLKKERKPLKQVFIDLEARGLFFDRYSKEEIVQLFDKLNLNSMLLVAITYLD
ncbi:DNA phosphorothioation-dependent restriction protein DptG [Bacillus sp. D-CC]